MYIIEGCSCNILNNYYNIIIIYKSTIGYNPIDYCVSFLTVSLLRNLLLYLVEGLGTYTVYSLITINCFWYYYYVVRFFQQWFPSSLPHMYSIGLTSSLIQLCCILQHLMDVLYFIRQKKISVIISVGGKPIVSNG